MDRKKLVNLIVLGIFILTSCKDDMVDLYQRPDWLVGKVYSQLKAQPDLSMFAKCIELTGYDTIIDKSGSYTVFAPNDEAITAYLQQHSYNTVEDIPLDVLNRIVKFHIVQNPWSKEQLQSLDVNGWIDTLDLNNNKPRGYKRQTLLLDDDVYFGVDYSTQKEHIVMVDSLQAKWYRRVINDTRKYAPIFFHEYFNLYNLKPADYEFYFDRPMQSMDDIYFDGSRMIGNEVFAENGFIYTVDRVNEPLKNAYQILKNESGNAYNKFLKLTYDFPTFEYNETKTFNQPGAEQGLEVDSLFDLTYPDLTFNIVSEDTKGPAGTQGLPDNVTIRYQHGLVAPTNAALDNFETEFLVGPGRWGSIEQAPEHIRRIIVNTHMSQNSIYPSDFSKGFLNGEKDIQTIDPATIVQKQYASNCTFIGVNQAIVPRAFKSVTGPIYLQRDYSTVMYSIEASGLLSSLKRQNQHYLFFVESDTRLHFDSSLVYNERQEVLEKAFAAYVLSPEPGTKSDMVSLTVKDLRTLLLNHVGIEQPRKVARKEFIKTMAGNHLIVNNETGEVRGTASTTRGYMGTEVVHDIPVPISTNADNGTTYAINNWFSFSAKSLYSIISGSHPTFIDLLVKAGLANRKEYRFTFTQENAAYTVFVPSEQALAAFPFDSLSNEEMRKVLMLHFIKGAVMFTDGRMNEGYYETARIDEKSTDFLKVYTRLHIKPGIDEISFPARQGGDFLTVPESENTNLIASEMLDDPALPFKVTKTSGVVHQIDRVLDFDELDTK